MDRASRNAAIAAAVFVVGFGVLAFYLPVIMIAVGNVSPIAAGVIAVLFVALFFVVLWLRARSQRGG